MDTGFSIFVGAVMATAGWLYSGRLQRNMDRRQHTYRIIIRQQDDPLFSAALTRIREILEKNKIPHPKDSLNRDDIDKLDYFLNHYEFIAAAIWCGDVDEGLIRSCEYSRITKLFTKMEKYINNCREYRQQPTMFENLENISKRWLGDKPTPGERLFEFVTMKPCQSCPAWGRYVNSACAKVSDLKRHLPFSN